MTSFVMRSITGRLLAAMLAVFLLAMSLQIAAYYEDVASRRALLRASIKSSARAAAAVLDDAIADTLGELNSSWASIRPELPPARAAGYMLALHPEWCGAGIVDPEAGVCYKAEGSLPANPEERLLASGAVAKSTVFPISGADGRTRFLVSSPVSTRNGTRIVVYAIISQSVVREAIAKALGRNTPAMVCDHKDTLLCSIGPDPPPNLMKGTAVSEISGWRVSVIDPQEMTSGGLRTRLARSFLISFIVAGLAVILGKRIASPIKKLSRAAAAVAVGDFRRRVNINTGDELQSLAESFNRMAENLEVHDIQLRSKTHVQETLFDLARSISSSLDLADVANSVSSALCQHFAATQVVIFQKDDHTGRIEPILERTDGADDLRLLAENALISPTAIYLPSSAPGSESNASVVVPLCVGERRVGVLAAKLSPNSLIGMEERNRVELLETFASWAAVALHNASIHGRTEEFMRMLDSLRQVVQAISSSLDLKQVLRALVRTTSHAMNAKCCAILLANESGQLEVAQSYNMSRRLKDKLKVEPGENWSGVAFAEKKPIIRADLWTETDLRLRGEAEKEGLRGLICAPLVVGNQAIGTINIWTAEPHVARPMEVHLLSSIASHAAAVIANAKLFGREYQIAETLQSTLKGDVPERIGRLSFGHKYLPALDEASVGGDLYDVISLPDGGVGLIVADVTGKGIQAAVHTAAIRYIARAYLFERPKSPAVVMEQLNRAIKHFAGPDLIVTVLCAVIDPTTGHAIYANAGHPPAILLTKSGKQQILLYRTGMPVGCMDDSRYTERTVELTPGDTLLLYTDGIIEAKQSGVMLSTEGLEDILFRHAHLGPMELVETVCEETGSFANRELRDDIAVVAAGFDL